MRESIGFGLMLLASMVLNLCLAFWMPRLQDASASTANSVCFPGIGCLMSDGNDVCIDEDGDGFACEEGEKNLTKNAPTNSNGDETVTGDLTVVGSLDVQGPGETERVVVWTQVDGGDLLNNGCLQPFVTNAATFTGCAQGTAAQQHSAVKLPWNMTFTKVCVQIIGSGMIAGESATIQWETSGGAVIVGQIIIAFSGGDVGQNGQACKQVIAPAYVAGTDITIRWIDNVAEVDNPIYFITTLYGYN